MANVKRSQSASNGPQRTVLGTLREAEIIDSKPVLPAGPYAWSSMSLDLTLARDPVVGTRSLDDYGSHSLRPRLEAYAGDGI